MPVKRNILLICLLFTIGCTSDRALKEQKKDKIMGNSIQKDTIIISGTTNSNKKTAQEAEATSLTDLVALEMNEFERLVLEADEEGIYLVQTEEGFDYIKADIDGDGHEDVAALITFEPNPDNYDFDTEVQIAIYTGFDDKYFSQYAYSNNIGGESIQYKDFKKLKWANGILTYTHQSMKNYMEIDIKPLDIKTQIVDRVSICYTSQDGCKDVYLASDNDTIDLYSLNMELLDSLK